MNGGNSLHILPPFRSEQNSFEMPVEFVEGWNIEQVLGEGAYGEVKLLINRYSGEAIAMKVIDLGKHRNAQEAVRKEICIHRRMQNPNIIKYWGHRKENNIEYIFLEYAPGGELFDRIEPDMGMHYREAKRYFKQLLSGVKYIHDLGIAHRDLKPENLLLDANDNLKISDFGLATVYRHQGRVRNLDTRCGTIPYVAPEVLQKSYIGEISDTWSCGVILIAMLAGELPWEQASEESYQYCSWIEIVNKKEGHQHFLYPPWCKLTDHMDAFDFIQKVLCPDLSQRVLIHEIHDQPWLLDEPEQIEIPAPTPSIGIIESSPNPKRQRFNLISLSQPEPRTCNLSPRNNFDTTDFGNFSLSQPTELDDLLVSSQLIYTPSAQSTSPTTKTQNLVKRMTRFFVLLTYSESLTRLCAILEDEGCTWKLNANTLTITGLAKLKIQLIFKANLIPMETKTLVDFRLSRGCGLEFKRHFLRIRSHLENVIEPVGPTR